MMNQAQAMRLRVSILDQERTFADALAARLEAESDVAVVAAVCARPPALRPVVAEHTDIVLLDADLPGGAAFTFCRELPGRGETPHVSMMSYSSEAARIVAAVRVGVAAWVRKDESLAHLLRVIRGVAHGETWLPPVVTGQVLRLMLSEGHQQGESARLVAALTPREGEDRPSLAAGPGRRQHESRAG